MTCAACKRNERVYACLYGEGGICVCSRHCLRAWLAANQKGEREDDGPE